MSYEYTNFQNEIPIIEKYRNDIYESSLVVSNYSDNKNRNFNYFIMDQSTASDVYSYILRVKKPIKNHQIFSCAAGGHGGLMYGTGANGGNYIYIDNTEKREGEGNLLEIGSYLIIPGKALDVLGILNRNAQFITLMNSITMNGNFYVIKYNNNVFNKYKSTSLEQVDNYKKENWLPRLTENSGEIINIETINQNRTAKPHNNNAWAMEIIFYLKKKTTFRFKNFTNPNYTRIIKISNTNNINIPFYPTVDNNYQYTAGDYDEMVSILSYPNGTPSVENQITWDDLMDLTVALNKNYYVYDLTKINEINQIDDLTTEISRNYNEKNTYIFYNTNPNASLRELKIKVEKYYLGLQGGVDGQIIDLTTNRYITPSVILRRYYMPYLFSVQNDANLFGGASGSTFFSNFQGNVLIRKLGGGNIINLKRINPRNIEINPTTREWISGMKGYYQDKFLLYGYYPLNQNIPLNNNTVANGGMSGYWQFLKDEINYRYGANGVNDLTSPFYGAYGCGGQGGSILIDRNSRFTGGIGNNGVFILSFLNAALAEIENDNPNVVSKMYNIFMNNSGIEKFTINNTNKFTYIQTLNRSDLTVNIPFAGQSNLIGILLYNSFIRNANVQLDEAYLTILESYIDRNNLRLLIASVYIIQRVYYLITISKTPITISKIRTLEINFINDYSKEGIEYSETSSIMKINICDKLNEEINDKTRNIIGYKYIKSYFETSGFNNYSDIISELRVNRKIIILKENNRSYDFTNNNKREIDDSYNQLNDYYKFIINTISYIYDISDKDFKINTNVIETFFMIFRLNLIVYSIIYTNSTLRNNTYTISMINKVYDNLKNYNYEIKAITDELKDYDNVFLQQNEFKLFFNNKIKDYETLYNKNVQNENLIKSKKAYMEQKDAIKKIVRITTIITIVILLIITVWLLFIVISNYSQYDKIPNYLFMIIILIITLVIVNYINHYYSYKEFFTTQATQIPITIMDESSYTIKDVIYNDEKYKLYYITKSTNFTYINNFNSSIVIINKGEIAPTVSSYLYNGGAGGTINIYNSDFIGNNLQNNTNYRINIIDYNINITNTTLTTNNRSVEDIAENVKVFYNNTSTSTSGRHITTFKSYYDNLTTTEIELRKIIDILFKATEDNRSGYFYGTKGNTNYTATPSSPSILINKMIQPNAYGLGGADMSISGNHDRTGNNGVVIIIMKENIGGNVHLDLQTLINFYNNNINKLIYDKFNKIYLIDNSVIYNNALDSYKKNYRTETEKSQHYKLMENNINDYSHTILMDVFFQFELVKLFMYIMIIIIIGIIIYQFNNKYYLTILIISIITIIIVLCYFYININKTTRRDYYKYYWTKYNSI